VTQDPVRSAKTGDGHRTVGEDGGLSVALLIRVWLEDGARTLRGRLTSVDTSPGRRGAPEATVALAASPEDVVEAVRAWLDAVLREPPRGVDGDG
jgi:hypothetical protein